MSEDPNLWKSSTPKRGELLVQYGFIRSDKKNEYSQNKETGVYESAEGKLNSDDADEELREITLSGGQYGGEYGKTGYPAPAKCYRLSWEVYDLSLEEPYFWILDFLKESFPKIIKLEDSFAAAENSAFFGVTQQRLGAQQEKVSGYLAQSGKMVKELFQMVRELRIIDERLKYYGTVEEELKKEINKRDRGAEITLKGIFVDLVQGGAKSAASVFGMSRELEFITLPDLFFDAPPFKNKEELANHIKALEKDFNRSVLRVLERHLTQYQGWRTATHKEHKDRRNFLLRYLLQHYEIIKMYLAWTKPYLKHVARLGLKEERMGSADLISAFEGSMLDVEILAQRPSDGVNSCILATFNYRTRPELKVVQEGYQRGPVHIGKVEITLRVYGWTDEQLENYKKLKEKETMLLLADVSSSVFTAMEALGSELDKYIAEAKGEVREEKSEGKSSKAEEKTFMEKFLGDFYTPKKVRDKKKSSHKSGKKALESQKEIEEKCKKAAQGAFGNCWNTYNNFKKSRGMIAW